MNFVHLHLHDQFSLLDGLGTADQYAARAKELDQGILTLTNHGNIDGLIKFQRACTKAGIKPVLGCELYMVPDLRKKEAKEKRHHMTVLIRDEAGFRNLLQMLSIANLEGHHYRPRVDPATVLGHREGLVFMSACVNSFVLMDGGLDLLLELRRTNPVALEIMPHDIQAQKDINLVKLDIACRYQIPLVATNDCHYPLAHQWRTQEMLLAIQRKAKWSDPDRWRFGFDGLHLRSAEEMVQAFARQRVLDPPTVIQAMENTVAIASLCDFRIERRPVELPKAHGYEDRDETELLWEIIEHGWSQRLEINTPPGADLNIYRVRLEEEMTQIIQMGFQRYFLIVWELVNWCHENGIMTGPGRGSVGGSLVAYLMYLTDVDPIRYGLIFARFISPERSDFPDIDMDFPQDRREEVRRHLDDCYGRYNVASITTFLTMKGSMALRDVARVFDLPGGQGSETDKAAKSIIDKPDGDPRAGHTIEDSLTQSPELQQFRIRYPEAVALAMELEGQARGYGKHAAAACISAEDLRDGARCNLAFREGTLVANWDKGDAEYMGLMKLDVLGLSTLSVLNYARELIKGTEIEFDKIPLDDPDVYREFAAGHCVGAFQLGTNLLIRLCKELGVREFNDLVLINALSRPGPLGAGMTDEFIARRKGQKSVTFIHPRLEPYTRETLGIVVYQEQVMWSMFELAGLSWGECDKVRKVMGKSKGAVEFERFKDRFVRGCSSQGTLPPGEAAHVWDQLSSFGSYGFNKAHAVEYSLIGYWTMYLKHHHPKEFMAALLTHGGEKYKASYVAEAQRLGMIISIPRIGTSLANRWVPGAGNSLLAPFTEIKGVGQAQAEKIVNPARPKPKTKKKKVKKAQKGFFDTAPAIIEEPITQPRNGNHIDEVLRKVGADGRVMTEAELQEAQQYFSFNIMDKGGRFKRLITLDPSLAQIPEHDLLSCNITANLLRIRKYVRKIEEFLPCDWCELRKQCRGPVNPSFGRYNVMVDGEAPGPDEDQQGMGFVGKAGVDVLWPELRKYGLSPLMFHITNAVKCFPGKIRTPGKKHIEACRPILEDEIRVLEPVVILAFGNTNLKLFKGQDSGISDLSGTTEWSDRYQCWICWCTHPASVLHGGSRADFERGIGNFAGVLGRLEGGRTRWNYGNAKGPCPYGGHFGAGNNNYLECESCGIWDQCAIMASQNDWAGLRNLGNRL
jgi:DNA polymerase-3 subunit alpha